MLAANPDHDLLKAWMDEHGPPLLDAARKAAQAERVFQGRKIERNPDEFVGKTVTMAGKSGIRWANTTLVSAHHGILRLEGSEQVTNIFDDEPDRKPITDMRNSSVPYWEIARSTVHHDTKDED
ncbi:hypothetical protein [Nonomuraea sp. KM90]|uniref:hypothetical protein n=1 Tax=Nonomuraea sp. KM90 TaxID=3457428 RepID=UPI003FCC6B13